MPALRTQSRALIASIAVGSVLLGGAPAFADNGIGGGTSGPPPATDTHGNANGDGTISATAGAVHFNRDNNGSGQSTGRVTSTSTWTPPACYYAPMYTPEQLQKAREPVWEADSTGYEWDAAQRDRFVNGNPYKDFNKDKIGKGYFWGSYVSEGRTGDPGALDCTKDYFWVDTGAAPPTDIPEAITPKMLADLAYAEIRVPSTKVTLAPAAATKVNLPTWAWLDAAQFKPVSVTASVQILGLQATTVAEPVSLRIEPGTADAQVYPASGVCTFVNGRIGEPYAAGKASQTPPCGVKYLRSSGDGSYPLRATITWKIHWTGTGVAQEQPLPDGEFGAEQAVVVQEIQAVNR